jgi:hypothetical protein
MVIEVKEVRLGRHSLWHSKNASPFCAERIGSFPVSVVDGQKPATRGRAVAAGGIKTGVLENTRVDNVHVLLFDASVH